MLKLKGQYAVKVHYMVQDLAFRGVVLFSDGICHCTRAQKQAIPVVGAKKENCLNSKKTTNDTAMHYPDWDYVTLNLKLYF